MAGKKGARHKRTLRRDQALAIGYAKLRAVDTGIQKLAKERLSELGEQFYEIAQHYRPSVLPVLLDHPISAKNGANKNGANDGTRMPAYTDYRLDHFRLWGRLAMEAFARVVSYESPALRAAVVGLQTTVPDRERPSDELWAQIMDEMMERGMIPPEMKLIEGVANEE